MSQFAAAEVVLTEAHMSTVMAPELTDFAIEFLKKGLNSWRGDRGFLYHLYMADPGQSIVFQTAVRLLNAVAKTVDEGIYGGWFSMERALGNDVANLQAYINQAIHGEPATV